MLVVDSATGRNKNGSLSDSFIAVDSATGGCENGSTLFALPGLVVGKLLDGLLTGLVASGVLLLNWFITGGPNDLGAVVGCVSPFRLSNRFCMYSDWSDGSTVRVVLGNGG